MLYCKKKVAGTRNIFVFFSDKVKIWYKCFFPVLYALNNVKFKILLQI